jgi:hypothetical protein
MRVSEITSALEGMDLSPAQLAELVTALGKAAAKSSDPTVKGFEVPLGDVVSDIEHEMWEEAEAARWQREKAEMRDDMAELAGAW